MCIRDRDKEEVKKIAVDGAVLLKSLADETEGNFTFEYSPESFPGTEVDYAVCLLYTSSGSRRPKTGQQYFCRKDKVFCI